MLSKGYLTVSVYGRLLKPWSTYVYAHRSPPGFPKIPSSEPTATFSCRKTLVVVLYLQVPSPRAAVAHLGTSAIDAIIRHPLQVASDRISDRGGVGLGVTISACGLEFIRDVCEFAAGTVASVFIGSTFDDACEEILQAGNPRQVVPLNVEG